MLFGNVLVAFDNTVTANLQPRILDMLGVDMLGEISKFPWINPTCSLGFVGAILAWGRLYSLFDHKILFVTAMIVLQVGSALSGAAPNMNAHIIGRAITGLGCSVLYLGTLNILSHLTSLQERPIYVNYLGSTWGIRTGSGPIIGGLFAQSSASWRGSFYLSVVAGPVVIPIYLLLLPSHRPERDMTLIRAIRQADALGVLIWIGALVSLVMLLSFGGSEYEWHSAQMIAIICCASVLWALFIVQQSSATLMSTDSAVFPVKVAGTLEIWLLGIQTAIAIGSLFIAIN